MILAGDAINTVPWSRAVFERVFPGAFTEGETWIKDVVVREINSTQRRRRLRLIKAEVEQADDRCRYAPSILAPASNTEAMRIEVDRIHRRMLIECRAKTATRIRIELPGKDTQIVTMSRPYLLIGSNPTCDLRLDHEDVSPQHAFLHWVNGQIFCCDLVPRLGADRRQQINGKWLDNQPINIGPYRLSLDNQEHPIKLDESPLDRSSQLAEEFPQLAFQFVGVEQSENLWSVNRTLTMIGRGSQCKLRLNHPSMPNVQACLLRTSHCCWLVDIEAKGTTGVNGRTISVAPIDIGDILQLGPFQIEVVTTPISKQDLSALGTRKTSDNSRQANKLERPSPVTVEKKSNSSDSPIKNQVTEQSVPVKAIPPKTAEPAQARKQPTVKESSIDPAIRPETESKVTHDSSPVAWNSVEILGEKKSVAEVDQHQLITNTDELPKSKPTLVAIGELEQSIGSFIQAHESQLLLLKSQLERVRAVYDKPRSQSISKRARSMLDKSMGEALKTHKLMQESFDKLTLSIKR